MGHSTRSRVLFFAMADTLLGQSSQTLAVVRIGAPLSAILISAGFFFSMLRPVATEPSGAVRLIYAGAVILVVAAITLAIGLIRNLPSA